MSNSVFEAALAKLSALRIEMEELEHFIRQYRAMEAKLMPVGASARVVRSPSEQSSHVFTKTFSTENRGLHFIPVTAQTNTSLSPTIRPPSKARFLAAAALKEIEADKRPIQVGELAQRIEANGIPIGGENPAANLSAHLNNSDWLVSLKGYGWWPKEKPYPPANYPGESPEKDEAAAPHSQSDAAASATPNNAVKRGEVGHDNMTL